MKPVPKLRVEQEIALPMRNSDGYVMAGVLHQPLERADTVVIAVHDFLQSKAQNLIRQACVELSRAGYDAYRFDLSGNGDSEGRFEDSTPNRMLRDISTVLEHFRANKRYRRLVLLGHGIGASLCAIIASRSKTDGLALVSPLFVERFGDTLLPTQRNELTSVGFTILTAERSVGHIPYTVHESFLLQARELDTLKAAHDIHCPVLLVHGKDDLHAPLAHSEELAAVLHRKDILILGGADRNLSRPADLDAFIARLVAWLG